MRLPGPINHLEVRAPVRVRLSFRCSKCGDVKPGTSSVDLEISSLDEDEVRRGVGRLGMGSIPVGWASYGRDEVRCERCLK